MAQELKNWLLLVENCESERGAREILRCKNMSCEHMHCAKIH
jgi:hypothetical protein